MHNVVALAGNLGTDVELRYSASGSAWGTTRLAVNDFYNDTQGQRQQKTYWFNVVFFGKNAEIAGEYCKKGSKIAVIGKLTERTWEEANTGAKRSTIEIRVDSLELLSKAEGANGQAYSGQGGGRGQNQQNSRQGSTTHARNGGPNQQDPAYGQELPPPPMGPEDEIPF